jgi:hypothetical protein
MKSLALTLLLAAATVAAQQAAPTNASNQPANQPDMFGRVTGHIVCSDTGKPARFAGIQLMPEQMPTQANAGLAAIAGSVDKDHLDFGKLMTQAMGAMMKGSNLSTMTAMDGSFSLDKVAAGTYYVIPQFAGYLSPMGQLSQKERMKADSAAMKAVESEAQKVVVTPGSTANLDFELDRGAAIGGTVHYDDGSPAPGVTPVLMLLEKDGKWNELPPSTMMPLTTDDQGHYRFAGLPPGKYAVKAALPTNSASMGMGASFAMHINMGDALVVYSGGAVWMKDVKPVELGSGDNRDDVDVTFPIDGLHVISGTVVAKSDQHPVNTGMVELQDPSDKTNKLRTTMIGKDGSFQFNYVPDGTYRVQVTGAADVEAAPGTDTTNPLAILMSGKQPKSFKEYGEAGMTLTLPGSSEGLTLQVPAASVAASN